MIVKETKREEVKRKGVTLKQESKSKWKNNKKLERRKRSSYLY